MHKLRLVLTVAMLGFLTAAIGAAPDTKRQATTKVSPTTRVVPEVSTDLETEESNPAEETADQVTMPTDFGAPAHEASQPSIPATAGVSGAPINMDWYSINNGGAIEVAAGNIKMGLSIGQNAVGEVAAGNIKMGLGFWYGAGSGSAPSCECDCHADPACDSLTNVFDVAFIVNVAFRNDPAIPDPNILCAYETTDVNCSNATDVIDVALMVDVAFRNDDPAVKFCNPCAAIL